MSDSEVGKTLYLGKETKVTNSNWDFGNSAVFVNVLPTDSKMVTNKEYVDAALDAIDKRVDTIFDATSVSPENFKNFVDYVSGNQRENEKELIESIKAASDAANTEAERAKSVEEEIKRLIDEEVARAKAAEEELKNNVNQSSGSPSSENRGINEDVQKLINDEIARSTAAESEINSSVELEVSRATTAENEIKASLLSEISRANSAEAYLKTRIDALYLYFFKGHGIPSE